MEIKEYIRAALLGPFAQQTIRDIIPRLVVVVIISLLTQVGGLLIWPALAINANDIGWKYRLQRWLAPLLCYVLGSWLLVQPLASLFDRVPLPCSPSSRYPIAARTQLTCLANRHYVPRKAHQSMLAVAKQLGRMLPNVSIYYLDANFPIGDIPLFPHQYYHTGKSLDVSLNWTIGKNQSVPSASPFGYGSYVSSEAETCFPPMLKRIGLSHLFSNQNLDKRNTSLIINLINQQENVRVILLERNLQKTLNRSLSKGVVFPCSMPQHDDHYHIEFF